MIKKTGFIFLMLALLIIPGAQIPAQPGSSSSSEEKGVIKGKLLLKEGGPMAGAMVFFFDALTGPPPFKGGIKRRPSLRADTDADGKFHAELPPGKYYIKAVKRVFSKTGDLEDGDYLFQGVDNKGTAIEYVVGRGDILNIGTVSNVLPYKKTEEIIRTAVSGLITDTEGNPVAGVRIFGFTNEATGKPFFYSKNTGTDGKYILGVPEGTYFLRARTRSKGGRPASGEYVGMFGGKTPVPVTVKDGEITKGTDITVTKIPERGSESGGGPRTGPK